MFIVNDLTFENTNLFAEDIATHLLINRYWCYSKFAPNVKKLKTGDKVLVYLAGKGRRHFFASFMLKDDVSAITNSEEGEYKWRRELNRLFQLSSQIDNIEKYNSPIALDQELRGNLDFIVDKKNWGLYFRQGIRALSEKDYQTITSAVQKIF